MLPTDVADDVEKAGTIRWTQLLLRCVRLRRTVPGNVAVVFVKNFRLRSSPFCHVQELAVAIPDLCNLNRLLFLVLRGQGDILLDEAS